MVSKYLTWRRLSAIGLLAVAAGCGSSDGESNIAPLVPEGVSPGQAQVEARRNAYGMLGDPRTTRRSPTVKLH
jgi:hypothetical protein